MDTLHLAQHLDVGARENHKPRRQISRTKSLTNPFKLAHVAMNQVISVLELMSKELLPPLDDLTGR